jgi:pyruvate kinase
VVEELVRALEALRAELKAFERGRAAELASVHANHTAGAANLVHYIGLRSRDLRVLQERLARMGLSSLGRAESHVLANVDKVLGLLHHMAGRAWIARDADEPAGFGSGRRMLERNAERLLGPSPPGRPVRIMVTLPSEAATDYALVRDLVAAGMDCARINGAHHDSEAWSAMISRRERARRETGRPCQVLFDLAAPKLRTGPVEPGPAVAKWRPRRDALGRVEAPARVLLRAEGRGGTNAGDAVLKVPADWLATLREGDAVELEDTRGAARKLRIREGDATARWAECSQTAYVANGTVLRRESAGGRLGPREAEVSGIVPRVEPLHLERGQSLVLTRDPAPGRNARVGADGRVLAPARIGCTLPEVFTMVRTGERTWFDDGRIGGVVRRVSAGEMEVEITQARDGGERLGADKGINLPDSEPDLPALTTKDLEDLAFAVPRVDVVGPSFVQRAADVAQLRDALARLGDPNRGIVLKIETRRAFENLPDLLLAAMASPACGVMIARGDLAVECGWERLAELQEEILWLAEAAHLPVIWATQVLETLARTGQPSRAEITDAAMGERAECVMLNKGPHILEAMHTLEDILGRMQSHQHKKRAMLRRLHWWEPAEGTSAAPR